MILNNENIPPGLVDLLPDEKELLRECSVRIPKNIFHQFELRIRIVKFRLHLSGFFVILLSDRAIGTHIFFYKKKLIKDENIN